MEKKAVKEFFKSLCHSEKPCEVMCEITSPEFPLCVALIQIIPHSKHIETVAVTPQFLSSSSLFVISAALPAFVLSPKQLCRMFGRLFSCRR